MSKRTVFFPSFIRIMDFQVEEEERSDHWVIYYRLGYLDNTDRKLSSFGGKSMLSKLIQHFSMRLLSCEPGATVKPQKTKHNGNVIKT